MRYLCESCGEETWLRALPHDPGEPIERVTGCCGGEDYVKAGDCTMCGTFLPATSLVDAEINGYDERLCAQCDHHRAKGEDVIRERKVVVEGKMINLMEVEVLYADGSFYSRGFTLYRTPKGALLWRQWSDHQGEDDSYELISSEEAMERLQRQRPPERVAKAVGMLRLGLEET